MAEERKNDKYKGLKKKIADELRGYERLYFREDKPVPFGTLILYPVQVRDFEEFSSTSSCLTLHKNDFPEGVRMSHLDFLVNKMKDEKEGPMWSYNFQRLCEIVFHIENGIKCSHCGQVIPYHSEKFKNFISKIQEATQSGNDDDMQKALTCPGCEQVGYTEIIKITEDAETHKAKLVINGQEINSNDFDRLRQIILFQNFADYRDDSWVDQSLRQDYEMRLDIQRRNAGTSASLENRVVALSLTSNYKIEEIWSLPIRKFAIALNMAEELINYKIMKTAVSSGFASLPKGQTVEHWLYKKEKDMYGDSYRTTESLENI